MLFNPYTPSAVAPSARNLDYDVVRSEEGVTLSIDIPGIDPADVELTVDGRSLRVEAARETAISEDVQVISRRSRSGAINQTFQIGEKLNTDELVADYNFGVLTITIPVAESAKPRKVEVGVGASAPAIDA